MTVSPKSKCPGCEDPECEGSEVEDKCAKDGCGKKKKPKKLDSVDRIDYWGPVTEKDQENFGYVKKFTKTDEGFLKGKSVVTNIGVFQYKQADGSIIRELRHPSEVLNEDSLASLAMKPVTMQHPKEKVSPTNAGKLQVGSLGNRLDTDAYHVYADLVVTGEAAIAAIDANELRGLSCGYSCDMLDELGTYLGVPYDRKQINIRYNHVALVSVPRAGDAAFIRMDSGEDVPLGNFIPSPISQDPKATPVSGAIHKDSVQEETQMKKIRLDGVNEHEVPEAVAAHIEKQDGALAAKESELSATVGKLDAANVALETLKKEHADSIASEPTRLDAAVSARLALVTVATKHGVEVKADAKDSEIRSALVAKAFPALVLDGKSDAYIGGVYDSALAALETASTRVDGSNSQRKETQDATKTEKTDSADYRSGWNNAHKHS